MKDNIPQIEDMRLGIDYRFKVSLRKFSVFFRPLTQSESVKVAANVLTYLQGLPQASRNALAEADIHAREVLKLASTSDMDTWDPQITDPMLDRMTNDEIRYLLREYMAVCDKVNPALDTVPEERLREMVEDIKKKPSTTTELCFWDLENVCRFLTRDG